MKFDLTESELDALLRLNSRHPARENIESALAEIMTSSDRGSALLSLNLVDTALEEALLRRLSIPFVGAARRQIFSGSLPSIGNKAKLCKTFGIIGNLTFSSLDGLAQIRNIFAHSAMPLKFDIKPLRQMCLQIDIVTKLRELNPAVRIVDPFDENDAKSVFVSSCIAIYDSLLYPLRGFSVSLVDGGAVGPSELPPNQTTPDFHGPTLP